MQGCSEDRAGVEPF
ncbi:hypothetical protein IEO21_11164 [Rhodonia placenta]|uniref:Uncharacterized protein n=1 Tax=Rhodonia placenta TaxID=104341 RepID=A0A8H7NQY2_9APHY|nr:hypothetical protein IEO21_11164 [Postia placenta]